MRLILQRCARTLTAGLVLLAVLFAGTARSADPQPYQVTLAPTGNAALDAALTGSSMLLSLRETAPVGGFALVQRALADRERFTTALHSFGYYKARIDQTIAGQAIDDPALAARIDSAPADQPVPVAVSFVLGPQFTLGRVAIAGLVPARVEAKLGLAAGDPALSAQVLAAQARLEDALRQDGYPFAKVPTPVAILQADRDQLDVTFAPVPGPQADIGPITVNGLQNMNQAFVHQRLTVRQGEPYSPTTLDAARSDLAALGPFASVRVQTADSLDAQGQIPVIFDVTERKLHAVDLGVAYSTDLGVNFNAGWHDRNLFGNGEQLNLTATNELGGTAITKPGYQAAAQFLKPDFLTRNQTLEMDLTALSQSLQAYDQTALLQKIALNRTFSPAWSASLGLSGEQESITQEGATNHYNLAGVPGTLRYDSTNNLMNPTRGVRATLSVTPMLSLSQATQTFVIMQANGSTYIDVTNDGFSVLALRGLLGQMAGGGVFGVPPDQRFYAGGSSTVRGYKYQTVGPQFADGKPIGGTAIAAGSVEFRQRFLDKYGIVAFVDAGQVNPSGSPFSGNWHAGAGIGGRYYTDFGPIRLDIAVPLEREHGGDSFELYISIGQAF